MLPVQLKDRKIKFISAGHVSDEIKQLIMNCSNIDQRQFDQAKFYEALDFGFLKIACFDYSNRKNNHDSFIRLNDGNYYNVIKIYDLNGETILLEKIYLYDLCPIIELSGLRTSLTHIHPIRCLETKEFCLKPVEFIEQQVCFVNLHKDLAETFIYLQYIIDVEN